MKVLVDLNVLLDVIQRREPHYAVSADLLSRITRGELEGSIAGHAVTTIHYVVSRYSDRDRAAKAIDWLLRKLEIVPEDQELFLRARTLGMEDFEDAVVAAAAERSECDRIISRNVADFEHSPVPAVTPRELRAELAVRKETTSDEGTDEGGEDEPP